MKPENGSSRIRQIVGIIGIIISLSILIANANTIFGLLSTAVRVGSTGLVVSSANIGVYWDSLCVRNVTAIDWGTLKPGDSKTVTLYVKNTGNVAMTLSLSTAEWDPQVASTYLSLTWDHQGVIIQPNEVLPVTLTLDVSTDVQDITSFSFNIYITGTQTT
jgi:archaellum component FlaG (FlaF/FlaG flagellin family)